MITTQVVERLDRNIKLILEKHNSLNKDMKELRTIIENVDERLKSGSVKPKDNEVDTRSDIDSGGKSEGSSETEGSGKLDSKPEDKAEGRDEKTSPG